MHSRYLKVTTSAGRVRFCWRFRPVARTASWSRRACRYERQEGRDRGYIVLSPVAPGELCFQGAARYLSELLDQIGEAYAVDDAQIHLGGISNGGLSAFVAALATPERFRSLTVMPGYPFDTMGLDSLAGVRITMFVGERDTRWRSRMDGTAAALEKLGADFHYEVVPGAGHVIRKPLARARVRPHRANAVTGGVTGAARE